jgi:HK97 family phage major capsid protein
MPDDANINSVIERLGRAFEEFKSTNDQRLKAIEAKSGTAHLDEKISKINADLGVLEQLKTQLDDLSKKALRPGAGGTPEDADKAEHKARFMRFVRKGDESGLGDLERKALQIAVNADGGFALPEEIDRTVSQRLVDISPIRSIATNVTVSTTDYKKLHDIRGTASGWVGETAARTATNSPQLAEIPAFMGEIYANPQATQTSLDDIFFDAEAWLAASIATEFAFREGAAFVAGDGTTKPKGFMAYTTAATADASRAFGTIEHVATGVSGGWPASNPSDVLISLIYKLKAGFRGNARWVTNKALLGEIRGFKETTGQYIWQPGLQAGMPSTLLGFPVVESEDVAAKAANSLSLALGDFRAGYCIVDRIGTRTLRDPYSNKPYVGFYATKRVGGMLLDSEAIKVIKFSTT